jgi:hypothetical protein
VLTPLQREAKERQEVCKFFFPLKAFIERLFEALEKLEKEVRIRLGAVCLRIG